MKIFVTGAAGQLGREFVELCRSKGVDVCANDRNSLDIGDLPKLREKIAQESPDYIVNAAAYTAVDKAEVEQEQAFAVNHLGSENLAKVCAELKIPLIHISTDYVFDGKKESSYVETDLALPAGVYGLSKLRGEDAIRDILDQHIILRVNWVFGLYGHNFVKTIQRLTREREELKVVDDQKGAPTSTFNIAQVILAIIDRIQLGTFTDFGTYHYCDAPESNWFEFTNAIIEETEKYEKLAVKKVQAITTDEFPTPAVRPMNSRLDCSKLFNTFGIEQYLWRPALSKMIKDLNKT